MPPESILVASDRHVDKSEDKHNDTVCDMTCEHNAPLSDIVSFFLDGDSQFGVLLTWAININVLSID